MTDSQMAVTFLCLAVIGWFVIAVRYYLLLERTKRELDQIEFVLMEGYRFEKSGGFWHWTKDNFEGDLRKAYRRAVLMKEYRDLRIPEAEREYKLGSFVED